MTKDVYIKDSEGRYVVATTAELLKVSRARVNSKYRKGAELTTTSNTFDYLFPKYATAKTESLGVIYLTTRHTIIEFVTHFNGSINGCAVHNRIILAHAIKVNAAALILSHNHPSGNPNPSSSDIKMTKELKKLMEQVDVDVLDHIILAGSEAVSMLQRGLI